ncbi:MAG: hypothetical protein ABL967_08045 [Bryobacteraceae bacterium]
MFRKLTSGQFCSAAHAKAYWKEQERLAVERLHQTHDSLMAYRPAGAIEAILGPGAADNLYYKDGEPDSQEFGGDTEVALPECVEPASPALPFYAEEVARRASNVDAVATPGFFPFAPPNAAVWQLNISLPQLADATWTPSAPVLPASDVPALQTSVAMANSLPSEYLRLSPEDVPTTSRLADAVESVLPKAGKLHTRIVFIAEPVTPELTMPIPAEVAADVVVEHVVETEEAVPPMAPLLAGTRTQLRIGEPVRPRAVGLVPATMQPLCAQFDLAVMAESRSHRITIEKEALWSAALLSGARMAPLPLRAAPMSASVRSNVQPAEMKGKADFASVRLGSIAAELRGPAMAWLVAHPVDTKSSARSPQGSGFLRVQPQPASLRNGHAAPAYSLQADTCPLSWKLASGIRYPVPARSQKIAVMEGQGIQPLTADTLPLEMPCDTTAPVSEPSAAWLMALPFDLADPRPAPDFITDQRSVARTDVAGPQPNAPASRLTAIQGTLEPQSRFSFLAAAARNAAGALEPQFAWTHAVDFWRNAPRDLKLLVFAIPTLLALALHPSLPKFRVTPPAAAASPAPSGLDSAMRVQFQNVRQSVASRAGVNLTEDFRAGLDDWQSRGDLSTAWSFDSNGFVRPGMLALYQPSMKLQDYEMNFLGLVDKKALSFVVRAQDYDNYYVVKLVILKPGPLPTVGITRYAVIDGKPQDRKDVVAPINARPDMLYRVSLNVHDDTFLLQMQGKIVDSWTEARLTHGGIGFFSAAGEESRLRWVEVTHQYDMLGRLCAYLAPYNMPTRNGSW